MAIGGIYLFDERFWQYLDDCLEQGITDLSITDINRIYVKEGSVKMLNVGEETWVDCGTPESLLQAGIMAKEGKLNPEPFDE